MSQISRKLWANFLRCGAALAMGLALAGCNRDQVKVQEVPKEADPAVPQEADTGGAPAAMPANPHAGMNLDMRGGATQPQLKWTLPAGWEQKAAGELQVGRFTATDKAGHSADVSIIPLPSGGPEMELTIYNMWRSELQLPAAQKADSEPVTVGSAQGKLFQVGDDKTAGEMVVAVIEKDGMSWYFKMAGETAAVNGIKPAFIDFLKTISFEAAPATAMDNPHAGMSVTADSPQTDSPVTSPATSAPLPAGWKEVPPTQFLLAKYEIAGDGGAKAEASVSMLGGTGGGVVANVTRWRGQLSLPPISEEELSKQMHTVDLAGVQATVVDMTGTDKTGKASRLIGVIAPQPDQTWFYKLMGNPQIVEQQKDAFTKFIQTAKFSNAP